LEPGSGSRSPTVVRLPVQGSDALLVSSIRAGDERALVELFDRHRAHVRRILLRVLGPDFELDDLVQDVFVAALEGLARLEDPKMFRRYLTSTAVFTARARIRKRKRWRPFLRFMAEPPESLRHPAPEVTEAMRATYRVLDVLPVEERIAFTLRFVEGMELTEVADAVGVSLATVKRRLARAGTTFKTSAQSEPSLRTWLEEGGRWSE
jgi:RNA polymerase sigma-70 factor (ECF subfamily)